MYAYPGLLLLVMVVVLVVMITASIFGVTPDEPDAGRPAIAVSFENMVAASSYWWCVRV
jgi:hypothetical protein